MEQIGFLVADSYAKKRAEEVLRTFPADEPHIRSIVRISSCRTCLAQAQKLIQEGVRVLITEAGFFSILNHSVTTVPVLPLYISMSDILYNLKLAERYNHIHLFLNDETAYDETFLPESLKSKIHLHRYNPAAPEEELAAMVHGIPLSGTAILGTSPFYQSVRIQCPFFVILPNTITVRTVYKYAQSMILYTDKEHHYISLLTTILSHTEEGLIIYDENGTILISNATAVRFLSLQPDTVKIQTVLCRDFPDNISYMSGQFHEKVIHRDDYTLHLHVSPFQIDGKKCYILTVRNADDVMHIEKNIRYNLAKSGLTARYHFDDIKTKDLAMMRIIASAKIIARQDAPVLIEGESGTGKELFAQSIHNYSDRKDGPFVAINCAALPPDLLESELFGYMGGSFTGARKEGKAGLFEMAHHGTIFLDEINSISSSIQAKLLRVLETSQVMRLGSDYMIPLDIRIISASNEDILQQMQQGKFRKDLYYRIHTLTLTLPSLNNRPNDIIYLFLFFLEQIQGRSLKKSLDPRLCHVLENHNWQGNIRELYSAALRYHLYSSHQDKDYTYLFDQPLNETQLSQDAISSEELKIDMGALHNAVDQTIITFLIENGCTQSQAARVLGISRQTLYNKLKSRNKM